MKPPITTKELTVEQRLEVAAWIEANLASLPESVRSFLEIHWAYLATSGDPRKALEAAWRELRRALHLTPSSEKRRASGSALDGLPHAPAGPGKSERETLEERLARCRHLSRWHKNLKRRHDARVRRMQERLATMPKDDETRIRAPEPIRLEDIELTAQDEADAEAAGEQFVEHLQRGGGIDPALTSVSETLMTNGGVVVADQREALPAPVPEDLVNAAVAKNLTEQRVRYDFSVTVTRVELEVEKKVLVDAAGQRRVFAASTAKYGPPRYEVTWEALATLTVLVGQFALPLHRLGTMFSSNTKRFSASSLSRMLHYVAERFVPIYLELARQLADADVLAGDDTSCRVLEVNAHARRGTQDPPPWADYRTRALAEQTFQRCEQTRRERLLRRAEGDRSAKPTPHERPSLGVLIARMHGFESDRKNGDGPKEAMHVSVLSGRSIAEDPRSLIVFYRSHLGSFGNLLEQLLARRDPRRANLIVQADMSSANLVTAPALLERFKIRVIGCSAHARRPFAIYLDEAPEHCESMLHLFLGLALHEQELDAIGRNRDNVLAVRGHESRELWNDILALSRTMAESWSKATNLGTAARYIIRHFDALTAYLDDPRLEPTNNLRERMLRTEKLIEGSSLFRSTLEGRFVLDVVRTILQTAVAAGVSPHAYLTAVLRAEVDDTHQHPERFTPRAWAAANPTGPPERPRPTTG